MEKKITKGMFFLSSDPHYVFSGDGGDVTAIVDDGTTLLIDSGLASRITELSGAIFKTTMRPVTGEYALAL